MIRLTLLAILASSGTLLEAGPDRPNILWITSEDNSPYLGCYGDPFAKTLKRMNDGLFTFSFSSGLIARFSASVSHGWQSAYRSGPAFASARKHSFHSMQR